MRHKLVSRADWLRARRALLEREKAFTRERDDLAAARRALPWVQLEQDYQFESTDGAVTLTDLFDGLSQLVVYHFMFDEDWVTGCKSCSFWADNFNGITAHLAARDVAFAAVSKAPLHKLETFRQRMGWRFRWVCSAGNVFGRDFGVSFTAQEIEQGNAAYNYGSSTAQLGELPGLSVFTRDDSGTIFHTYSCYGRGLDILNTAYHHLDLTPRGRDEADLDYPMAWVRLRDEYPA